MDKTRALLSRVCRLSQAAYATGVSAASPVVVPCCGLVGQFVAARVGVHRHGGCLLPQAAGLPVMMASIESHL